MTSRVALAEAVRDARQRTLDLVADLDDDQLLGPRLAIVNPPLWEIGHVAWFQERWVLRHALGRGPVRPEVDALYDSTAIPHDVRWDLPLISRAGVVGYLREVRDRVLGVLDGGEPGEKERYFILLSIFHEDMHSEAFTYARQTHGYPAPRFTGRAHAAPAGRSGDGPLRGDVAVPGGTFALGAKEGDEEFVFDNEKWAHEVEIAPFEIARAPVTQEELAAFVEEGGYAREDLWSEAGWRWRKAEGAEHPVYWRRDGGRGWLRRDFDRWVPLEPHRPVLHVSWHEAEAYCRFAGRRLPTEAEWEAAAAGELDPSTGRLAARKRRLPWGDAAPVADRASLDWAAAGCVDVGAYPGSDSAFGCRQMIGNVWEWTATDFGPYPGFVADPYKEYSEPWFGTHKVLRGGCWATRGRLLRNTWRNFYAPDRRDVWAGFRTCRAR